MSKFKLFIHILTVVKLKNNVFNPLSVKYHKKKFFLQSKRDRTGHINGKISSDPGKKSSVSLVKDTLGTNHSAGG